MPDAHREAIDRLCAFPETTIALLTAVDYVLAHDTCDAEVGGMATIRGYGWTAGMVFVPRESEWTSLADLNGRSWAFPSSISLESYLFPLQMFEEQAVAPVTRLQSGSDGEAVAAVYGGRADFGTAFYSPLWVDGKPVDWSPGDPADVPEDLVRYCTTTSDGKAILCTNLHIRDARREVRDRFTDVVQKVRVLATTPRLPNDAVAFGARFPPELKQIFLTALSDFAARDAETFTKLLAPYGWTGMIVAADSDYELARLAVGAAGIGFEDLDP
jgi:ABC-type phosphate/phosphonate transport system substrate-binding protein